MLSIVKYMAKRFEREIIDRELLTNISQRVKSPVAKTAETFHLSREAIYKHLRRLINENVIEVITDKGRKEYKLKPIKSLIRQYSLSEKTQEYKIWNEVSKDFLFALDEEAKIICSYGFTEMVNNAIDHSAGQELEIYISLTAAYIRLGVKDNGIGIFNKIAEAFHLDEPKEAILELLKGKLTTDPERHSGEGIFFSSRVFDNFIIKSSDLMYFFKIGDKDLDGDWLVQTEEQDGTLVLMQLSLPPHRTLDSVFQEYDSKKGNLQFSKTHVPLSLGLLGEENLVSRSQAKRVLSRFEKFDEVILDFSGIKSIGQAFADEIFRVFRNQHPNTTIYTMGTNESIERMIKRARQKLEPNTEKNQIE